MRCTDYNFMGYNAYNVTAAPMVPEQLPHLKRVYNNVAIPIGAPKITEGEIQALPGRIIVATNENGKVTGWACINNGTLKALIFYPGRIHEPTCRALEAAAGVECRTARTV